MSIPITTANNPLDVLIVGGGLSGLVSGWKLLQHRPSTSWHLIESLPNFGGRILNSNASTLVTSSSSSSSFVTNDERLDMGGAWIWPHEQPQMMSFLQELLPSDDDDDYLENVVIIQPEDHSRVRIRGGAARIIETLVERLSPHLSSCTTAISCTRLDAVGSKGDVMEIKCHLGDHCDTSPKVIYARHLIWTAPPRRSTLARISWNPPLSRRKQLAQARAGTWMSTVTKVAFVYDDEHHRWGDTKWIRRLKYGLGARARSRPRNVDSNPEVVVFDIYDACTHNDKHGDGSYGNATTAFTVFSLVTSQNDNSASPRPVPKEDIARLAMNELVQGAKLASLLDVAKWMTSFSRAHVQNWSSVASISDDWNPDSVGDHPMPQPELSMSEWPLSNGIGGMVHFAGTESDLNSPGLMDGAVGAAFRAVGEVLTVLDSVKRP